MLHAFFKQLTAGGNIYAGRTLWLRSTSLSLSHGNPLTPWTNEGSAGGTFTAPGGSEPTYLTNQVNSLPAVTFQNLQFLVSTLTTSQILGSGQAWSFVVVARGIGDEVGVAPGPPFLTSVPGNIFNMQVLTRTILPTVSSVNYSGGIYTSGSAFVFGCSNAASGSHHILNSTATSNANLGSISGAASHVLRIAGAPYFGFMSICEMMAFNKFKTAAELSAIAAAMRTKYAIS
jgi:hypothetical protein